MTSEWRWQSRRQTISCSAWSWSSVGSCERGSDVVAEADVASRGFGVSGALGGAALAVVFGGVAQLLVDEAGAREEASSRAGWCRRRRRRVCRRRCRE
jgi:hypothetical protein